MTREAFLEHVAEHNGPESDWPPTLRALWHAQKGEWDRAHTLAQDIDNADGSWIHANLHREEGDLGNARYWYARAGRAESHESVADERLALIRHFLSA